MAASTASGHLARLEAEGLVTAEVRGRHRYFRLAGEDILRVLEALALVAEREGHARAWSSPARLRLRCARSCYGHLAGRLGVQMLDAMLRQGWLRSVPGGYGLTAAGGEALVAMGVKLDGLEAKPADAAVAKPCLDWSERRDHLAGPLANALLHHCLDAGWLRRRDGERSLAVTPPGLQALGRWMTVPET